MKRLIRNRLGFTIVELGIVIIVIGILATLGTVAYQGVRSNAANKSVESDMTAVEGEVVGYGTAHVGTYGSSINWSSASGVTNTNIEFKASAGNVIVVSGDVMTYCIKIYNPRSSLYKTLGTAYRKGNTDTACEPAGTRIASSGSSCAIDYNDVTYCWGSNTNGRLGNGNTTKQAIPTAVSTDSDLFDVTIKSISKGTTHTCAIASDDWVYCWGNNTNGRLGDDTTTTRNKAVWITSNGAVDYDDGDRFMQVVAGSDSTCAVGFNGYVYCWGTGSSGQMGNGTSTATNKKPVAVTKTGVLNGKKVEKIATANGTFCVIASDFKVYCWGAGTNGRVGDGTASNALNPVAVDATGVLSGKKITQIAMNDEASCALATDGTVACWGPNTNGSFGKGNTTSSNTPVAAFNAGLLASKKIKSIAMGGATSCAITTDNGIYCWGQAGALGNGGSSASNTPTAVVTSGVLAGKTPSSIMTDGISTHLITTDGLLYGWGGTSASPVGDNSTVTRTSPVLITMPTP